MSTRIRRRRRRHVHRIWRKVLILIGVLVVAGLVAGGIAAAWALNIYNSAPPLSSLKPVQKGRSSAIYAADGSLIGYINSNNIRQPIPASELPEHAEERDDLDRGQGLLAARRARPAAHRRRRLAGPARRRQAGPGRLDDHPAAGPQPLHPEPRRHAPPKADRSPPGRRPVRKARPRMDPHPVPQHRSLRHQRRADRGRRRSGVADLLQQAGQGPQPDRGGAARRPAAGALRIQPLHQPESGAEPAQRGAGDDGRAGLHHPRPSTARRRPAGSASTRATSTPTSRTSSSTTWSRAN